jgi:hypothetical protein
MEIVGSKLGTDVIQQWVYYSSVKQELVDIFGRRENISDKERLH